MIDGSGWGTIAEKRFIDGLGGHSNLAEGRAHLLRSYIAALSLRFRWGSLDRYAIEAYATRSLQIEIKAGQ